MHAAIGDSQPALGRPPTRSFRRRANLTNPPAPFLTCDISPAPKRKFPLIDDSLYDTPEGTMPTYQPDADHVPEPTRAAKRAKRWARRNVGLEDETTEHDDGGDRRGFSARSRRGCKQRRRRHSNKENSSDEASNSGRRKSNKSARQRRRQRAKNKVSRKARK